MAGRPEKGKRYAASGINRAARAALLGSITAPSPDDMSMLSTGMEQGPTMSGDSLGGPDMSALEPLAPRRMEAVDTRSGLEKWFKPNSAGEFNNRMAYEEGANNLQLNRALAELKAKAGWDKMSAQQQFDFATKLEELRNNNAITQQGLKAGDDKERSILDHINAVAATKGLFNTGKLPLEDLNAPVIRSTLAKSGAEAGFYESPDGQAAIRERFAALEAAPGVANTTKLGDLKVSERNATVGERTAGVAEAGVPIAKQNADTSRQVADTNKRLADRQIVSAGDSMVEWGADGKPYLSAYNPIKTFENLFDPKIGQNVSMPTGIRGEAIIPKQPVPFNKALLPAPEVVPAGATPQPFAQTGIESGQEAITPGIFTTGDQMSKLNGFLEAIKRLNVRPTQLNPNGFNLR